MFLMVNEKLAKYIIMGVIMKKYKFKYKKIKLNELFIGKLLFIFAGITILTTLAIIYEELIWENINQKNLN